MKDFIHLFLLVCFCSFALSAQNCTELENFNNHDNGDLISEVDNDWTIIDPAFNDDGLVLDQNLGGNNTPYLFILEPGELTDDQTYVRFNNNDTEDEFFNLSLDLNKNVDFLTSSGAKFFINCKYQGSSETLEFFYDQDDNIDIFFDGNSIFENIPTQGWETWRFIFSSSTIIVLIEDIFVGEIDINGIVEVESIDFCGNSGSYFIDNICFQENLIGYDCDESVYISCNDDGDDFIEDSLNPNSNVFPSTQATDLLDDHDDCDNIDDGCDSSNDYNGHGTTGHEIIYEVIPSGGNLVLDLNWSSSSDDLDLFLYEQCNTEGPFDCIGSSTYGGTDFQSIIVDNPSAGFEMKAIVDAQNSGDETGFVFSVTCGDLVDHQKKILKCGTPVEGNTEDSKNYNSFYCNCQFQTRNDGRQNYGKEHVYEFTIDESGETAIILEILDPTIDLNLYLLDDCDVFECARASDSQQPGETERIDFDGSSSNMLPPGDYTVVVDGFRGDEGPYRLTLEHVSCADPCQNSQALSCERFEHYQADDLINDQDNWSQGNSGNISCKVVDNGFNKYLAVDQENFDVCASRYTFPSNTTPDGIESVNFDLYLPFNEGFSFFLNESDPNANIFFNFSDYFGGGSTAINYLVNNVVMSQNGDYETFDYPYDQWFSIEITLDKAADMMSVFINDQQLFRADGIMIDDLMDIAFDANLTNQGGNGEAARIDNLCQHTCSPTPPINPCTNTNDLYCDDFEQCAVGDVVNDKDNWTDSFFAGELFVKSDNNNEYIAVEQDGMDDAGAIFELPIHAGTDDIEILSFATWIPDQCGLSTLYEASNGQGMFIDLTITNTYGPRVNIGIGNVFFTYDPITGDSYIPAPYEANEWFDIEVQLDRSNEDMEIYINEQLVVSVANTGIDELKSVEFTSALSFSNESRVDDVCVSVCASCVEPYLEILDCDQVVITSTEPSSNNEIKVDLTASPSLDIQYWEIWNKTDGFTDQINTADNTITTFFLIGNDYQVCVYYINDEGCLIKCCLDDLTSLQEVELEGLNVFPNPFSDQLFIEYQNGHPLKYKVIDLNGQLLEKGILKDNIRLDNLAKGVYLLELLDENTNTKSTVRIVKI